MKSASRAFSSSLADATRASLERIEGLDRADSYAVLEELFAIAEDRSIVYEHVWTPGDLVMWDNR